MTDTLLPRAATAPARHIFWVTLLLITLAEMLVVAWPALGLLLHGLLLVALLTYSGVASGADARNLALGLTLAPLIRLLSLSLPLPRLPQMAWYPAVALPLLLMLWLLARAIGVTRSQLGLRRGRLPLQLALVLGGPGLGAIEYLILRPAQQQGAGSAAMLALMSLSLLVFTGLVEELIFRGLLQSLAPLVLGRWGLAYVSLLFGVLHIGYLSPADLVFVTLVGLLFAQLVRWGGSILGVTLAHGATNMSLFLLMPWLAVQPTEAFLAGAAALIFLAALCFVLVGGILALEAEGARLAAQPRPNMQLRELRRSRSLSYLALAQQAGLAARRLAEIEIGARQALPDERVRIAAALGVTPPSLSF